LGAGALIAIDTNIILRFLTRQPKAQFQAARSLFRKGGLFVSTPVVMEVYFTLTGSVLAFEDQHALEASDAVLRLPGVEASRLVTFDKPFAKSAAKLKLRPVVQMP
jgi:predicted nucleic acid-binding protein